CKRKGTQAVNRACRDTLWTGAKPIGDQQRSCPSNLSREKMGKWTGVRHKRSLQGCNKPSRFSSCDSRTLDAALSWPFLHKSKKPSLRDMSMPLNILVEFLIA